MNKIIGGPKKTFLQLFNVLNERTEDQSAKDLIQVRQMSPGLTWLQQILNMFTNDRVHVSVQWLIAPVTKEGLSVRHLLRVKHESTGATHYVAVFSDSRYVATRSRFSYRTNCGCYSDPGAWATGISVANKDNAIGICLKPT
ncbi:hypothetical protein B0H14DRAFT_2632618 [Mycena olivaceomarginata]|nr:hypothetical protein B0H14DRAFT_2632618 [Mycena olivaceomarginata]